MPSHFPGITYTKVVLLAARVNIDQHFINSGSPAWGNY